MGFFAPLQAATQANQTQEELGFVIYFHMEILKQKQVKCLADARLHVRLFVYSPIRRAMRILFVFLLIIGNFYCPPAQAMGANQAQAIAALLGAQTPLWTLNNPGYKQGGMTLGYYAPTQDRYLTLRYTRQEKGHLAHISLSHHTHYPKDADCLSREKAIAYQHPQLGAWTLCSSVNPHHPEFVMVRAFALNQKAPYLQISFVGPVNDLIPLMGSFQALPMPAQQWPSASLASLATRFYPSSQQVYWRNPAYAPGDYQLFWKDDKSPPQISQAYHRAIPYLPQQVTLHMTAVFRHTPTSQLATKMTCNAGQKMSRYVHPQLGPYRLCTKVISTAAHASGSDKTPLVHHLVSARPLAGNRRPQVSFHIHGLPQEIPTLLRQLKMP